MIKASRKLFIVLGLAASFGVLISRSARAQDFECSAGPHNGAICQSDDDCFGACPSDFGACVLVQGVCNGGDNFDGFPCDCPGGNCVGGTCSGGIFNGDSCTAEGGNGTCDPGVSCVASQRVCLAGDLKGFPCLNDNQCSPSVCVATGKFCDSGDFQDYSCVDSLDCIPTTGTGGTCVTADGGCMDLTPTPTKTLRTIVPTATRTPTPPTVVIGGTNTPTKTPPTGTVSPTVTGSTPPPSRTPTQTVSPLRTLSPTASPTLAPNSALVAESAPRGTNQLVVANAEQLPLSGTIASIDGQPITCGDDYVRADGSNTLELRDALDREVPAGSMISVGRVQCTREFVDQGGGCSTVGSGGGAGGVLLIGGAALGIILRRRVSLR